jgi:hypothetical protein
MMLPRPVVVVVLFVLCFPFAARAQEETPFPTDDEVQLLLTQADRAMKQYKPLIDQEESVLGKSGAEAVAKDRQVVQAVEIAVEILKKNPQGFNSPAGFALFEWLDDANRNALLCSTTALTQSTAFMMVGKTDAANGLIHLAQSCMDVSALIYTVSENAGSLYERYVKAEQHLAEKGFKVSQQCAEALKKMAAGKKR